MRLTFSYCFHFIISLIFRWPEVDSLKLEHKFVVSYCFCEALLYLYHITTMSVLQCKQMNKPTIQIIFRFCLAFHKLKVYMYKYINTFFSSLIFEVWILCLLLIFHFSLFLCEHAKLSSLCFLLSTNRINSYLLFHRQSGCMRCSISADSADTHWIYFLQCNAMYCGVQWLHCVHRAAFTCW